MTDVIQQMPSDAKGPLESKTMAKGAMLVVGAALAHWNPVVGDWVRNNADTILGVVGTLAIAFRGTTSQPINFRDWTIAGVGFKF